MEENERTTVKSLDEVYQDYCRCKPNHPYSYILSELIDYLEVQDNPLSPETFKSFIFVSDFIPTEKNIKNRKKAVKSFLGFILRYHPKISSNEIYSELKKFHRTEYAGVKDRSHYENKRDIISEDDVQKIKNYMNKNKMAKEFYIIVFLGYGCTVSQLIDIKYSDIYPSEEESKSNIKLKSYRGKENVITVKNNVIETVRKSFESEVHLFETRRSESKVKPGGTPYTRQLIKRMLDNVGKAVVGRPVSSDMFRLAGKIKK